MSNTVKRASDRKSKIMALIQEDLDTEGNAKNSLIETLKTTVAGGAGLGLGAVIGKPSLLTGLAIIFIGQYYKSSKIVAAGIGMVAGGAYKAQSSINGTEVGGLDGAKERLKALGQDMKERLYIDKIKGLISKKAESGTSGLGNVSYFEYPKEVEGLDMGSLDAIEREINRQAEAFESRRGGQTFEHVDGNEDEERIY
jgi:hypothetical protein